ncbi:MAG TPA: hypothetical protein VNT32_13570 [Thermoleophilaceae bacterium]|nr:hypothetical protein [Thermoleophilaceae bacterium]
MRPFAGEGELDLLSGPVPRSIPRPSRLAERIAIKPPRAQKALDTLGLATTGDLLEHLPFRHEDRREARSIADLAAGEDATVVCEVRRIAKRPTRRRRLTLTEATVADESGPMKAVWFNQPWLVDRLPPGSVVVLHGRYEGNNRFRVSEHELASSPSASDLSSTGFAPVYPSTEGIPSARIRELVHSARDRIGDMIEPLPARLRAAERLADRAAALRAAHFPESEEDLAPARERLAFEELFLLELALAGRRLALEEGLRALPLGPTGELVDPWLGTLPFEPTGDQRAAFAEIDADLASERPMQRLLMGEVGSGKTVALSPGVSAETVRASRRSRGRCSSRSPTVSSPSASAASADFFGEMLSAPASRDGRGQCSGAPSRRSRLSSSEVANAVGTRP